MRVRNTSGIAKSSDQLSGNWAPRRTLAPVVICHVTSALFSRCDRIGVLVECVARGVVAVGLLFELFKG